jgi:hypothetical protein
MVLKVISGGQRGADLAGLKAAKLFNLPTGGHAPKGYRTLDGARPEYRELYGLEETPTREYPPRTALNVRNSDATIRFALDWNTPGECLTKRILDRAKKPYFDVDLNDPKPVPECYEWWQNHNIQVLNIAGNAGHNPEEAGCIERCTLMYLELLFQMLHVGDYNAPT